jgi:hypothetical protein
LRQAPALSDCKYWKLELFEVGLIKLELNSEKKLAQMEATYKTGSLIRFKISPVNEEIKKRKDISNEVIIQITVGFFIRLGDFFRYHL